MALMHSGRAGTPLPQIAICCGFVRLVQTYKVSDRVTSRSEVRLSWLQLLQRWRESMLRCDRDATAQTILDFG